MRSSRAWDGLGPSGLEVTIWPKQKFEIENKTIKIKQLTIAISCSLANDSLSVADGKKSKEQKHSLTWMNK